MSTLTPDGSCITLDGPASLPIVIPHLIGFHPTNSLVVIGLDATKSTVKVTCRADLIDESELPSMDWTSIVRALRRSSCVGVIVAIYPQDGSELRDLPHQEVVVSLVETLTAAGFVVRDALALSGMKYRSYWCADDGCCPADGNEPGPDHILSLSAALVFEGSSPRGSRAELVAALTPREPQDPIMKALATRRGGIEMRMPAGVEAKVQCLIEAFGQEEPISDSERIRLTVITAWVCADIPTRDVFLYFLTKDPDGRTLAKARDILGEVVRCSNGHERATAGASLAVCAWVSGDGASARVAVDVALEADPSCRLAALVGVALDDGQPPRLWSRLMDEIPLPLLLGACAQGE